VRLPHLVFYPPPGVSSRAAPKTAGDGAAETSRPRAPVTPRSVRASKQARARRVASGWLVGGHLKIVVESSA